MRKWTLIFLCLTLMFNSCKKEEENQPSSNTGTNISEDLWGVEISNLPEYYFTSDVPISQVDKIRKGYEIASVAWGNYGPLEYWIIGNDISLADSLDVIFCNTRLDRDPSLGINYYQNCINRDYSFSDYVTDGGAGLNTRRSEYEDYSVFIITHGSKNPYPSESDYLVVAMHEYFHVYQEAHIFTKDEQKRSESMPVNPWWVEGGATYMSELLYSEQPGVDPNYLQQTMQWKIQNVSNFLSLGIRIEDIQHGDINTQYAYELGAWFSAFLIYNVGIESYLVHFYDNLNNLGFEQSFVVNFGKSSQEFLDDFLNLSISEQLQILP